MAGNSSLCFIAVSFSYKYTLLFLPLLAVIAAAIAGISIWWEERVKVYNMPKRPMIICDKHGAYPSELTLSIDAVAEGRADLKVDICPMCYADRLKAIEGKLK